MSAPAAPHPLRRQVEAAGLMHELTAGLLEAATVGAALQRLAALTAVAVPPVARCSVVLIGDGEPLTFAASGEHGRGLDESQYTTGQGPGLDAARTRAMVTTHDLATDPRWPELHACGLAEGVHAVASVPIDVPRVSVGSLTLIAARAERIEPETLVTAMAIVGQAEVLLAEVHRRSRTAEIDRAAGVIIAQRGCGVADAYAVLDDIAGRLGLDRHVVAGRLIAAAVRNAGKPVDGRPEG